MWREKTNKMQQLDVIINFCLNMFRASLCLSSGEQRPCYCIWCVVLVLLDVVDSGCGVLRCRMRAVLASYNAQDFISSIFRVKFTTETLKIGTESFSVKPVTISSMTQRRITDNANVWVMWLWNCRQQHRLSTVSHLRGIKERSQDSVVLKNVSRPCPGVCEAQTELTPTLSSQNGVCFSELPPYNLLHNSSASAILLL